MLSVLTILYFTHINRTNIMICRNWFTLQRWIGNQELFIRSGCLIHLFHVPIAQMADGISHSSPEPVHDTRYELSLSLEQSINHVDPLLSMLHTVTSQTHINGSSGMVNLDLQSHHPVANKGAFKNQIKRLGTTKNCS